MTTCSDAPLVVAALYAFRRLDDYVARQKPLQVLTSQHGVFGTLLLAQEGINGTIAGSRVGIDAVIAHIRSWPGFDDLEWKESTADEMPFLRMKVRLKDEIVTMGVTNLDPGKDAGTYVDPRDWNALISRDDVVVIDTRNDYEVAIGSFPRAIDPATKSFRAFPQWSVEHVLNQDKPPKIAMFCTGGIRCEKASAYLKANGVPEVYHLKGGILKYLEDVDEDESLWQGECFVFDRRVSVRHGLEQGSYQACAICRRPFKFADDEGEVTGGIAERPCPACEDTATAEQKARAEARQKQINLADVRGEPHLGPMQVRKSKKKNKSPVD